jgi:hypothetical protein
MIGCDLVVFCFDDADVFVGDDDDDTYDREENVTVRERS